MISIHIFILPLVSGNFVTPYKETLFFGGGGGGLGGCPKTAAETIKCVHLLVISQNPFHKDTLMSVKAGQVQK